MQENNIKISFEYDIHEMMEIKAEDAWYLQNIKIIIDTTNMRRKKGWVEKLEDEMAERLEGVYTEENHESTVLNIRDMFNYYNVKGSQEECYKFATKDLIYRESLLKKFRIKNYEIIYEFQSDLYFIEEMKESLREAEKNPIDRVDYEDDVIDDGEEPF